MIGVGIVTFNPNINRLENSIKALLTQKCQILIVDNTAKTLDDLEYFKNEYGCSIIYNVQNCGVAKAYNQIMEFFSVQNIEYVLTLDQDSVCPTNIIEEYLKFIDVSRCGILCPVLDYKGDKRGVEKDAEFVEVGTCISSASLINIDAWKESGGFDENLFIDFVDFDFCYAIREKGFKIYQIQSVHLDHELGNLKVEYLLGTKIMVTNHSPLRKYYYIRNAVLCHKKHIKLYPTKRLLKDILHNYIKTILYEKDKVERLSNMNKGLLEGIRTKI